MWSPVHLALRIRPGWASKDPITSLQITSLLKVSNIKWHGLGHPYSQSAKGVTVHYESVGHTSRQRPVTEFYPAGTLFIHKTFGYRGIVLHGWPVLCERKGVLLDQSPLVNEVLGDGEKEVQNLGIQSHINLHPDLRHNMYLVLMSGKDFPYTGFRLPGSVVHYYRDGVRKEILEQTDYCSHEDIYPFVRPKRFQPSPVDHDYFDKFFRTVQSEDSDDMEYKPTDQLLLWLESVRSLVEFETVVSQTSNNVGVTVIACYSGVLEDTRRKHVWRYLIQMESYDDQNTIQLISREWKVLSRGEGPGNFEKISGDGVAGRQPIFTPNEPVFKYMSYIPLEKSGCMWGNYNFQYVDSVTHKQIKKSSEFKVIIPAFNLVVPVMQHSYEGF